MRVDEFHIYEYRLPLKQPLRLKDRSVTERRGLLIKITGSSGHSGWGDVAPLPGFSLETLAEARTQLLGLREAIDSTVIHEDLALVRREYREKISAEELHPSVGFGIGTAVLNVLSAYHGVPPAEVIGPTHRNQIPLNALLGGSDDELIEAAYQARERGYRAIKIKVGRSAVAADIATVRRLDEELGGSVPIRVDANQNWDYDQALLFAKATSRCNIEYVEEPLDDPYLLPDLHDESGLPIALDESLVDTEPGELPGYLSAVILKPTVLGGLSMAVQMAEAASALGVRPIVSSSFESGVGIIALSNLAAALGDADIPCGLDTLGWFEQDVLTNPPTVINGTYQLEQLERCMNTIDMSRLTEIADA
ncbi:MAG: o-succinylbenzoate synthase [Candidatus Zixiibacteriota bacterium]